MSSEIQGRRRVQQMPATNRSGEGWSFVCFKIPGKEGYHFFHCRFRTGDCWEGYLKERK
jgi:hypothetical protein